MKAIVVMYDSLNRHLLPPYGQTWVKAPNFERLAERTVTFDRSYVCSMPCMPARRDLHTGRPNFLHRSWGPLEPFDDSVPSMLAEAGVSTHLVSDHYHYWEDGGCTYHTKYSTWQFFRGQEGDPWQGQVAEPRVPPGALRGRRQDWVNRQFMRSEEHQPQARTFGAGLDFIRRNAAEDNWVLQIETFDPHEPFFTQRKYKDLYAEHYRRYRGRFFDWPPYRSVQETPEEVEHARHEYAALVSMCDHYLGEVIDLMDELGLWEDTMLIVWTDHGFLLGEHACWAKIWMPFYEEVAHTPFWVWDPRSGGRVERRSALVQPAIDIGPTLLSAFGLEPTPDMRGHDLADTVAADRAVRAAALFGLFGAQVNVTDGRYVYMRGPANDANAPLNEYTLMPTHMNVPFSAAELRGTIGLADPFAFTKGCRTMQIGVDRSRLSFGVRNPDALRTLLFDLEQDPRQERPSSDPHVERSMVEHLVRLMRASDAPEEQYERLGL